MGLSATDPWHGKIRWAAGIPILGKWTSRSIFDKVGLAHGGPRSHHRLQDSAAKIPLEKHMTAPEEIAAMIVFLLSARAAHITAQHTFVDGGHV